MNKNNSVYIIIYATIMVVVVAAVLAIAAMVLQPVQNANIEVEKKGDVLASVGLAQDAGKVKNKTAYIEEEYAKYITERTVTTADGRELPLYESNANGRKLYIIPVRGSGLWGPVWGYVAVEGDWNTIAGVVFGHQGETPGLGAEITTPKFTGQFVGKKLFEGGRLVGITVLKGAGASRGNDHAVDAISGGTITSRAVENMIRACLLDYATYIESAKNSVQFSTSRELSSELDSQGEDENQN